MFDDCCNEHKMMMLFKCSAAELNRCLEENFYNPELYKTVAEEYLLERSHYRQSGILTRRFNRGVLISRPGDSVPNDPGPYQYRYEKLLQVVI